MPLFTGGRLKGDQLIAEANLHEAEARYDQLREFAALDARVTINDLLEARAAWRRARAPRPGSPGLFDCGSSLSRRYFHAARAERLADFARTGGRQPCAGSEKSAGRAGQAGAAAESAVVEKQRQSGAGIGTIAGAAVGFSGNTNTKYAKRRAGSGSVRTSPGPTGHSNTVIATRLI